LGNDYNSTLFTMLEVASQTINESLVDIGDSFTFQVTIDLPGIDIDDKADVSFEIFAIDQNGSKSPFMHMQTHSACPNL
jgi:hypothetical protein